MKRYRSALLACVAGASLCGASPPPAVPQADTTTIVETTASATVDFPPDRLTIAIDVEAEAGAPDPVDSKTLDLAVTRLTASGIPASAVLKRYITTPADRWRRLATDLDGRPYGIVLLQFAKPSRTALVTLTEQTLPAALAEPLSESAFAEIGGAWYGLDDCKRLRVAARKGALALARDRGEELARAAGFTVDASGIRAAAAAEAATPDTTEAAQSYVCGHDALPDIPPPQLHTATTASERSGFVEEESTITVDWPTLPLGAPQPLTLPNNLSSLGSIDSGDDQDGPRLVLAPGMLRSIVAISAADVNGGSGCPFDRALAAALALATRRAAIVGRFVGLVPDRPITIVDGTDYRAHCPAHGPTDTAEVARIAETFDAVGAQVSHGASSHLEASGTAHLKVSADRARVVASVVPGSGSSTSDAASRLGAAGLERATLHVRGQNPLTVDGYVSHPTAAIMASVDSALTGIAAPASVPARAFAYAVDDCSALNDRVLRAAVSAAQAAARADAKRRGVRLHAVSALEAGPIHVTNCGPHVLEKMPLTPPTTADAAAAPTDAGVSADGTVRLLYSL